MMPSSTNNISGATGSNNEGSQIFQQCLDLNEDLLIAAAEYQSQMTFQQAIEYQSLVHTYLIEMASYLDRINDSTTTSAQHDFGPHLSQSIALYYKNKEFSSVKPVAASIHPPTTTIPTAASNNNVINIPPSESLMYRGTPTFPMMMPAPGPSYSRLPVPIPKLRPQMFYPPTSFNAKPSSTSASSTSHHHNPTGRGRGRCWTDDEEQRLTLCLDKYNPALDKKEIKSATVAKLISKDYIPTKTPSQVRSKMQIMRNQRN